MWHLIMGERFLATFARNNMDRRYLIDVNPTLFEIDEALTARVGAHGSRFGVKEESTSENQR